MGRGDKKTKKGKRFSSSYGRLRPRKGKREIFVIKEKKVETVEQDQKKVLTKFNLHNFLDLAFSSRICPVNFRH